MEVLTFCKQLKGEHNAESIAEIGFCIEVGRNHECSRVNVDIAHSVESIGLDYIFFDISSGDVPSQAEYLKEIWLYFYWLRRTGS